MSAAVTQINSQDNQDRRVDPRILDKYKREMGPLLSKLIEDPLTEDIVLNPDGRLWARRRGKKFAVVGTMEDYDALMWLGTVAFMRGDKVINAESPLLECDLPIYKSRLEALVPPVVTSPIFAIRPRPRSVFSLDDYHSRGILTHKDDPNNRRRQRENRLSEIAGMNHKEILEHAVVNRWNILVAGSTGSGKTTFCNALLEAQSRLCPDDRTLLIEDTPELHCEVENHVPLLSSLKFTMLDCLRACMRLKPDRISVGEVRGGEALTLLKAWNTGHGGGFATLHANDGYASLLRLESLIREAITDVDQGDLIAEVVNLVVFIDGDPTLPNGRKVKEVCLVVGYENGRYLIEQV
jgi:type IV secretion system protein VirB11